MTEDRLESVTAEAFERAGLEDMRPACRALLVSLRRIDSGAFEEASRRYRESVEPAIANGEADPVTAWLEYGRWLASRVAPGHLVAVDGTGLARPLEPGAATAPGDLVLHLPDDHRAPPVALAGPREPSESQRITSDLLLR